MLGVVEKKSVARLSSDEHHLYLDYSSCSMDGQFRGIMGLSVPSYVFLAVGFIYILPL